MVVIRLARGGSHNRPFYSIIAADSRSRRDGRFVEKLGFYNPVPAAGVEAVRINFDRVAYWTSVGAQLSPAVKKLLKNNKQ